MKKPVPLYIKYLRMNLKSILEYRLSAWFVAVSQFLTAFFSFLSIGLLFRRFGSLGGWSFAEIVLCFAVTSTAFALSECIARGFDTFSGMLIRGEFDRVLLRPRSPMLQVLGARTEITRMARVFLGLALLCYFVPRGEILWSPLKVITLILMIAGGAAVFTGVFILGAAVCFYTLEGLELINIFTDGGRELAAYPLPVYGKWIRRFFTFVIPFGCMNYLPLMFITGRAAAHPYLYMLCPLLGFVFLVPCAALWRKGVRRYTSSGS
jgi:ABC-2 type transport system permease protein